MQTYDAIMILVLVLTTVIGFWKGMAWQLASLASLIASYFISLKLSAQFAPYFGQQAPLNRFSAQLALYIASSFVIWMLFRFVSGAINKVKLESFDKQMGALLGFAKGVLLCVAITFFAVTLAPQPQGQAIVSSQSGRYIVVLLNKADAVCPPELHQVVGPYLNTIEERLNPNFQPKGGDLQQIWQNQVKANIPNMPSMPQINWPSPNQPATSQPVWPGTQQNQPKPSAWPTPSGTQSSWPSTPPAQPRTAESSDPYGAVR
ncbi:MAG TPA: CvpA family protein [Lacipirellulaceae bacterium]|jgi:membrane protein required for colicin V production|nr:CvpA family protein [Lacipirellulaceae bacterium]